MVSDTSFAHSRDSDESSFLRIFKRFTLGFTFYTIFLKMSVQF